MTFGKLDKLISIANKLFISIQEALQRIQKQQFIYTIETQITTILNIQQRSHTPFLAVNNLNFKH